MHVSLRLPKVAWAGEADSAASGPEEPITFERQLSVRVARETAELNRRIRMPTEPVRITEGTGEVYQVWTFDQHASIERCETTFCTQIVDHGTGTRAIFKPAAQADQAERQLSDYTGSSRSPTPSTSSAESDSTDAHRKEVVELHVSRIVC